MNEQNLKKLEEIKKLVTFKDNPQLAIFLELRELNTLLKTLTGKEKLIVEAFANFPKIEFPEFPRPTDLTETNNLIKKLLKENVSIKLKIE